MEKKELKFKKEKLTNLTNLNTREMEELKGGRVLKEQETLPAVWLSVTLCNTISIY
ncbi:MAG: hypothetical protein H6Q14_2780 [Bacteroidetes bacterium]|nr:hypothetical protein [Bacteroidota bacterium]